MSLTVSADEAFLDAIADGVAARLADRLSSAGADDPWMDVDQAAEYLACKPHRIHDLISQGRLRYDGRDGRRGLFRRSSLDRYAEEGGEGR